MKGTLRPGRKAGVLALAVLLLTCVLMAGAVSASDGKTETVSNYNELVANLSDDSVEKIILGSNIDASAEISVNRSVTIDGQYHTISAKPGWSQVDGQKNLLVIENGKGGAPAVTLENIFFEGYGNATADTLWYADPSDSNRDALKPYMGAHGIQVYNTGTTQMQLKNITINASQGSGIHVNGANVALVDVTVKNSVWQSVDVGSGEDVTNKAVLTIDAKTDLQDAVQINVDDPNNAEPTVNLPDSTSYEPYSFFYDDKGYGEKKLVWSTDVDKAAEKIAESKGVTFNATVQNPDDPVALHTNLTEALTTYVDSGAIVTILEDLEHVYDYQNGPVNRPTITKAITLNLNGKTINAKATYAANNDDRAVGFIMMKDSGSLTVTGNGEITLDGPYMFYAGGLGSLIIESGTFKAKGTIAATNGANENAQIIIKGGSLTSENSPVVFMPGTKVLQISGNSVLTGPVGIDIKSGIVTISENAQIIATGADSYAQTENGNGPVGDSGTAIVLERTSAYKGDLTLTIQDNAAIKSNNGAAIRNYIRENDMGTYSVPVITIKDTASISGSTAAIENAHYSGDTSGTIVGSFHLNGGTYESSQKEFPLKDINPIYPEGSPGLVQDENGNYYVPQPPAPQPVYSSGGNMNNAYRVLFNDGSTTLSVQTDLSSGDKLTKPETPVKDGYTFAGWYKDSACTQAWDFETGISGDMTLYAKWTAAGSSGETEATTAPTATSTAVTTPQPTKTQTAAATTSAPQATTAAGVSPTLTQAPAPVAGALFGLLAAGVLLRRRFQ